MRNIADDTLLDGLRVKRTNNFHRLSEAKVAFMQTSTQSASAPHLGSGPLVLNQTSRECFKPYFARFTILELSVSNSPKSDFLCK